MHRSSFAIFFLEINSEKKLSRSSRDRVLILAREKVEGMLKYSLCLVPPICIIMS